MTENLREQGRRTATFMLTDVEGSTRLWERDARSMGANMARHDELIAQAVARHGGYLVRARGEGDSSFSVFDDAGQAAGAAIEIQRSLTAEAWRGGMALRVRLAIHVGDAESRDGDYYGSAVNRCARLRGLAAGGQSVMSARAQALVVHTLPDGAYLVDLGAHRLKDLAEPERVYQLSHPDLPSDFPDLRGLESVPNNLPVQLTTFIGREHEVEELTDLLKRERLVTLTGTGGCGKTRLALQVAAGVSDRFDGGVWFVDLSATTDPALVASAVAAALGVGEPAGIPAGERVDGVMLGAVAERLRGTRALLILDNCEHLLETVAQFAQALLGQSRALAIMATSRELLAVPGEQAWHVPPLTAPDPAALGEPSEFRRFESVRLFIDRAQHHDRRFELSSRNCRAVAEICRGLSGLPLALELAAARVRVLSVEQISGRLNDQFRLLSSGARGLSRQATLRATVDWSYNLLNEDEAQLLRGLGVFTGGWTLDAAEDIFGREGLDVLAVLGHLVDKSLVVRDAQQEPGRFHLLEPIRQYALEKLLESGTVDEVRERHLQWYWGIGVRASRELKGPRQVELLALLDAELDNIRAALDWCLSHGLTDALELATALRTYWLYRSLIFEGRHWLEQALDSCVTAPPALRAEAMLGAARLALQAEDIRQARELCHSARELAEAEKLTSWRAHANRYLALCDSYAGDLDAGMVSWRLAIDEARAINDDHLLALNLLDAANCALDAGLPSDALVEEGLTLARRMGGVRDVAFGLWQRGRCALSAGEPDRALPSLREALAMTRPLGDRLQVCSVLVTLAQAQSDLGDSAAARVALLEAIDTAGDVGALDELATGIEMAAGLAAEGGSFEVAARLLGGAQAIRGSSAKQLAGAQRDRVDRLGRVLSDRLDAGAIQGSRADELSRDGVLREAKEFLQPTSAPHSAG